MNLKRLADLERKTYGQQAKEKLEKLNMMLEIQQHLGLPLPAGSDFDEGLKRLQAAIAAENLEPFVRWVEVEKRRVADDLLTESGND